MQASTFAVKGATFGVQKQKALVGFGDFRNGSVLRPRRVCMTNNNNSCGLKLGYVSMETEITSTRIGSSGIFGSSAKPRSVRVQSFWLVEREFDLVLGYGFGSLDADDVMSKEANEEDKVDSVSIDLEEPSSATKKRGQSSSSTSMQSRRKSGEKHVES